MQKFTIFTIIFSVIVVTIVAELVAQDYLQKLYPPSGSVQANVNADDFSYFYPGLSEEQQAQEGTDTPEEPMEEEETEESKSRVRRILEETRGQIEEQLEEGETIESVRISTLLPALNIEGITYQAAPYPGTIFGVLPTEDLDVKNISYGVFSTEENIVGSAYELEIKNDVTAENVYQRLAEKANVFEEIEINETNQFGSRSFYINNAVKVNDVFVILQKDNFIYAFAYAKQYHEIFKSFFAVLV